MRTSRRPEFTAADADLVREMANALWPESKRDAPEYSAALNLARRIDAPRRARWTWRKARAAGWRVLLFWRPPIGPGEWGPGYRVHWWSFAHHFECWLRRRRYRALYAGFPSVDLRRDGS